MFKKFWQYIIHHKKIEHESTRFEIDQEQVDKTVKEYAEAGFGLIKGKVAPSETDDTVLVKTPLGVFKVKVHKSGVKKNLGI